MVAQSVRALRSSALTAHLGTLRAQARGALSDGMLLVSGLWRIFAVSFDALFVALERQWRARADSPLPEIAPAVAWAFRAAARLAAASARLAAFVQRATAAHVRLATRFDARISRFAVPSAILE